MLIGNIPTIETGIAKVKKLVALNDIKNCVSFPALLAVITFLLLNAAACTTRPGETGLVAGRLRPCPATPNCVSSEPGVAAEARIIPLTFTGSPEKAWIRLQQTLKNMGGTIIEEQDGYLRAVFTSRIFRFVDDMEFRLAVVDKVIHLRSGSRLGYSDLGINRHRVGQLRDLFAAGPALNGK